MEQLVYYQNLTRNWTNDMTREPLFESDFNPSTETPSGGVRILFLWLRIINKRQRIIIITFDYTKLVKIDEKFNW